MQSPQSKSNVKGDSSEAMHLNAQQKTRSISIKVEGNCGVNSKAKDLKQKKQGANSKGPKTLK